MHIIDTFSDHLAQSPEGKLWDGDAPSAPAGGDTPAPAAAPTPAAPSAAPTATPPAPQAPATPGAPGEGWVPSYRLRETREAAQRELQNQFAERESQYQAELQRINSQLQALVGVQPPPNPQVAAIRQQFGSLYPGLNALEQRAQDIMQFLERAGDIESQQTHYWESYGRQNMDKLFKLASDTYEGPITDEAKRVLHNAFVGFVSSSPEMTERYSQDPTIVEDFWKAFQSSFIDPSRRSVAAGIAARATVPAGPQDTPGSVPPVTPGPKPANLDERVAMGWAQYNANKK